jgi:hypothetical protein
MKVYYGPSIVNDGYKDYMQRILEVGFRQRLEQGEFLEECEILVEEVGDQMRYIYAKPWTYSFLVSGEPFHHEQKPYTMVLCGNNEQVKDKRKCILLPLYYFQTNLGRSLATLRPWGGPVPEKFACAFVSNPLNPFRNRFLQVLRSIGLLDSYGLVENTFDGSRFQGDIIEKMKEYKFNICFENANHEQYITEKIIHPLIAGIIPVYWGCSNIGMHFEIRRFLWVKEQTDEAIISTIQTMIGISQSDGLWMTMATQPIWASGGGPPITLETMGEDLHRYLVK